jgi:hypothetical protein
MPQMMVGIDLVDPNCKVLADETNSFPFAYYARMSQNGFELR